MIRTYRQKRQRGVGMLGILLICIAIVLVVVGALKVIPTYLEYRSIAAAAVAAKAGGRTVVDVQKAFDRAANINDITTISGQDLEITKEGENIIVSFKYEKKIPLFYGVSLLIEYSGSSERP